MGVPEIYEKCKSTLRETSKDKRSKTECFYVVDDTTIPVYNYDKIVKKYASKVHMPILPASNDALYIGKRGIIFIEFKNGNTSEHQLIKKSYDSFAVLFDENMGLEWADAKFKNNISYSRKHIAYILVLGESKNPRQEIHNQIERNSFPNLKKLKGFLYSDMKVYTGEELLMFLKAKESD